MDKKSKDVPLSDKDKNDDISDIEEIIDGLTSISREDLQDDLSGPDFEKGMEILKQESLDDFEAVIDEVPYWAKKINRDSLEAVRKAGYILPELKPVPNEKYHVRLISPIKHVISKKGEFDVVTINNDGLRESLKVNESFKFSLLSEKERLGLSFRDIENIPVVFLKKDDGFMVVQINK